MINSSFGICTTGTKKTIQKVDIYFEDNILNLKKFKLSLFPWMRIGQLKRQLAIHKYKEKIFVGDIRLFCKNIQLINEKKGFFDYYKIQPDSTIIIRKAKVEENIENGVINPYQIFQRTPQEIDSLIMNVQNGLSAGRKPKLASQGTSGTYFLQNHLKKIVAVYKPFDQQPYAPNNPRNFVGQLGSQGIRKGILSGQCATRQVAAYLLDINHFHCIPATTYVQFYHPSFSYPSLCHPNIHSTLPTLPCELKTKHGSLQQFVQYSDVVGNLGSHQFDLDQVHKIAILDLRILNCDRNEANILVKKMMIVEKGKTGGKFMRLIPIDHGLSFPDNLQIYDYQIVWMGYRQAEQPLSQKSLAFIDKIDPVKDCQMLREKLGFRQICLRNFRIAQIFLKKMAKAGFTLYEIGKMVYRTDDDDSEQQQPVKTKISQLQKLVKQAQTIFFTVKQNGIKSTVQFQIGLIKLRKQQQSLPQIEQAKQIGSQQSKKQLPSCQDKQNELRLKQTSIERYPGAKLTGFPSPHKQKIRNISLPNLKKKSSSMREKKLKIRKVQDRKNSAVRGSNENWGEIFFHYFEDLLDRFIVEKEKTKKKHATPARSRLMSENIQL